MQTFTCLVILLTASVVGLSQPHSTTRIDRLDATGQLYDGVVSGDTITSEIQDLGSSRSACVSYRIRRVYPPAITHRRWSQDSLLGPEFASVESGKKFAGDSVILEWFHPSKGWVRLSSPFDAEFNRVPDLTGYLRSRTALVPDSLLTGTDSERSNMRYRIILRASAQTSRDDEDPFDILDRRVFTESDHDLAIVASEIVVPYSITPYHQSRALPWRVIVANRTATVMTNVRVWANFENAKVPGAIVSAEILIDTIEAYREYTTSATSVDLTPILRGVSDVIVSTTRIVDHGLTNGNVDIEDSNDTLITEHTIRRGRVLSYDDYEREGHHAVAQEAGFNNNFGLRTPAKSSIKDDDENARYGGGSLTGPGGITMSFRLGQRDTLFGYQFAFDRESVRDSTCLVKVSRVLDQDQVVLVDGTSLEFVPGRSSRGDVLDTIGWYDLADPVVLEPGAYEMTLMQRGESPLHLCATARRGAVNVVVASSDPVSAFSCISDPSWFVDVRQTPIKVEDRANPPFPFWNEWFHGRGRPFIGDRGYHHYSFGNMSGAVNGENTFRRGVWIPVMRLVFGGASIVTSITEHADKGSQGATFAPNPATGTAVITNTSQNPVHVELWSILGDRVWSALINGPTALDLTGFAAGSYVMRTIALHGTIATRTIIIY